jgi:hypothetical protein
VAGNERARRISNPASWPPSHHAVRAAAQGGAHPHNIHKRGLEGGGSAQPPPAQMARTGTGAPPQASFAPAVGDGLCVGPFRLRFPYATSVLRNVGKSQSARAQVELQPDLYRERRAARNAQ